MNATRTLASTAFVAMWRDPSTANVLTAVSWTLPTPSAWVSVPILVFKLTFLCQENEYYFHFRNPTVALH